MTIEFQYLKNKKTGKIKSAGYTDLSSQADENYELIIGELPENHEMEGFSKSPSFKAKEIADKWALYFNQLAKTDAGIVIAYEQECILLENALKNAGRVAELENTELNLDFVFYKISQLETKNGVNTEKLQEIKNKLIELCQV